VQDAALADAVFCAGVDNHKTVFPVNSYNLKFLFGSYLHTRPCLRPYHYRRQLHGFFFLLDRQSLPLRFDLFFQVFYIGSLIF